MTQYSYPGNVSVCRVQLHFANVVRLGQTDVALRAFGEGRSGTSALPAGALPPGVAGASGNTDADEPELPG